MGWGEGEWVRGGKEDEWIKEKKNNPSLSTGLEPGRPLGIGGEGRSRRAAWRPLGRPRGGQPALRPPRPAWARGAGCGERGSQMAAGRAAQAGQRQGRGRVRPRGSRTPEPAPIVVAAEGRGSKTASEAREAAPWSLSRRVPGEAVMAAPWERGAGVRRRSLAAGGDVVFFRAPRVPAEPGEHPAQVMRGPSRTRRGAQPSLDASIV